MQYDINEIMTMLDWKNDIDVQSKGRKLASDIQCLKIFMQPMDKMYNKNVWENCAMVLSDKVDVMLSPYLFDLIGWLKDMNWPGAYIILERLQVFREFEIFSFAIKECVRTAKALNDEIWLMNMAELLKQKELIKHLPDDVYLSLLEVADDVRNED